MVSHDIDASLRYASHILHLGQEGQLFFGTQKEYRRSAVYHDFLGDRAVPMWKHDFPNRVGRAAPREEAEPAETESRVKIHSGKKSSRRLTEGSGSPEGRDGKKNGMHVKNEKASGSRSDERHGGKSVKKAVEKTGEKTGKTEG
jgi:hypothetical protein